MAEGRGEIAGYEFGTRSVVRSPLGIEDLDLLKQTVLFGEEDEEHLRMAGDVLEDQVEDVLDVTRMLASDPDGLREHESKALELLLPYLFDANLRPHRLSTFGSADRTMHWNLMGEGNQGSTRVGYVWPHHPFHQSYLQVVRRVLGELKEPA